MSIVTDGMYLSLSANHGHDDDDDDSCSVKVGKVVVEKGGKVLATLGPSTILGEMSTLGRYETSASVRGMSRQPPSDSFQSSRIELHYSRTMVEPAAEFGTVCQLIDCSYIEQLFRVSMSLCHCLCVSLASFSSIACVSRSRALPQVHLGTRAQAVATYGRPACES